MLWHGNFFIIDVNELFNYFFFFCESKIEIESPFILNPSSSYFWDYTVFH